MAKIKKIAVSALAALAVAASTLSLGASAYSDIGTWRFHNNPHSSHTIEDYKLNFYSLGYRAFISDKGYSGAYNYVTISQNGSVKTTLTERGVVCQTFEGMACVDKDGRMFSPFRVQMYAEYTDAGTPYNNGEIRVANQF